MHKCLNQFGRLFVCILIATTMLGLNSGGLYSSQDTVSTTWCLNQVEKVSKQNESCRSELSETRIKLEKSNGKKNGVIEKLGIFSLGVVAVYSSFNPLVLIGEAYLILFQ